MYMNRMSEVGIRKVFGAQRFQLLLQFLIDSLLITFISLVIGIILFEVFHRGIFDYLGTRVVLSFSHLKYFIAIITGIVLTVGVVSGGYPALFLSRFKPIDVMRKNLVSFSSRFSFRKIIVILQSSITIILLTGTIIIYLQLKFLRNDDLGFNKENVAIVGFSSTQEAGKYYPAFSEEIRKHSGILAVSGSFMVPGSSSFATMSILKKGSSREESVQLTNVAADYDYVKALGLQIVQGRDFSRSYPTDANESVLINETASKELNLNNPVGEQLSIPVGSNGKNELKSVSVIGVVKDFHMKSKHQKIAPMIFYMIPNYIVCVVRLAPNNIPNTLQYIRDTWKSVGPGSNINIKYLDAMVDKMYRAEEKIGNFIAGFAVIAIIISCLGLLGLTSFIINRKVKEVGIRKVLGADVGGLIFHLSKQFMLWVLLANFVAWPVSYYLINKWLQDFAYKIDISVWVFILAGVMTLVISFITIMFRIIKTARANPVEALKYE
jgi:putative ABC transport system permease protein